MTDNRTTELLPCPFCGGEAYVTTMQWNEGYEAQVGCRNMPNFHELKVWDEDEDEAKHKAIAAWNTRTPEQAVAATLGDEKPKKCCSTCQYRYVTGQRPYPTFGYMCGFGDGKGLCGDNRSVLDHMGCEHWEKELE